MRQTIPIARRLLEENDDTMLRMRWFYAEALYRAEDATLDDVHEAVTTLEDAARIARRVLGVAHPTAVGIEAALRDLRAVLRAREEETPSGGA